MNIISEYGSEFDWNSNNKYFKEENFQPYFKDATYLRSGRDALKAIAYIHKNTHGSVLLPALCCDSMVKPFLDNGYDIIFYKLNNDLSVDNKDVILKLKDNSIFIYMDYFGMKSLNYEQLNNIKFSCENLVIVEDVTHNIEKINDHALIPDYVVASIRKWLALPDGGVLYSYKYNINCQIKKNNYFSNLRIDALKNKSEYLITGKNEIKELYRSQFLDANLLLYDNDIYGASEESILILNKINFIDILDVRKNNAYVLNDMLKGYKKIKVLTDDTDKSNLYFPILVNNRDNVQNSLSKQNVYCPVIWPLPKIAQGLCKNSEYISNNMLALPCDQRYSVDDMKYICDSLISILEKK